MLYCFRLLFPQYTHNVFFYFFSYVRTYVRSFVHFLHRVSIVIFGKAFITVHFVWHRFVFVTMFSVFDVRLFVWWLFNVGGGVFYSLAHSFACTFVCSFVHPPVFVSLFACLILLPLRALFSHSFPLAIAVHKSTYIA